MAQILAVLQRILSVLSTVLSLLGLISGQTSKAAQENVPFSIDTNVSIIKEIVTDAVIGNAAIRAAVDAMASDLAADYFTISAALGSVQQSGLPVTLPTVPPAGYGGSTPDDIAGFVWAYTLPSDQTAGDQMDNAGNLARNFAAGGVAFNLGNASAFTLYGTWWSNNGPDGPSSAPAWVPANILPDDTLLTFLDRESGYTGWNYDHDKHAYILQDVTFNDYRYTTLIDELQFQMLKATVAPSVPSTGPPVWPFGGDVTWGDPVPLSTTFTIDADMDGVLVLIDSVPPQTSFFNFDGTKSYRFIGALAFFNTEHDIEFPQNLGFESGMYCPKAMSRADGVILRVKQGVTGTATPWINN